MKERTYICCDLKSFYASVECIERGLNPLDTNLVVADLSRTEKTICLAVTPSLKAYGISGRARLFEVIQRVKEVNNQRQRNTPGRQFTGASSHDPEVLYTALTRARELLVIVGDDAAVRSIAANNKQQKRYSGLKWRLCHAGDANGE